MSISVGATPASSAAVNSAFGSDLVPLVMPLPTSRAASFPAWRPHTLLSSGVPLASVSTSLQSAFELLQVLTQLNPPTPPIFAKATSPPSSASSASSASWRQRPRADPVPAPAPVPLRGGASAAVTKTLLRGIDMHLSHALFAANQVRADTEQQQQHQHQPRSGSPLLSPSSLSSATPDAQQEALLMFDAEWSTAREIAHEWAEQFGWRCHYFLDDSNIYIEGSRLAAQRSQLHCPYDVRFRYDPRKLVSQCIDHALLELGDAGMVPQELATGALPIQSLGAVRGSNTETREGLFREFERRMMIHQGTVALQDVSEWTGRENDVDHALIVDMADAQHQMLPWHDIVLLFSGDRGFVPELQSLLRNTSAMVVVLSWKNSQASRYRELAAQHPGRMLTLDLEFLWDREAALQTSGSVLYHPTFFFEHYRSMSRLIGARDRASMALHVALSPLEASELADVRGHSGQRLTPEQRRNLRRLCANICADISATLQLRLPWGVSFLRLRLTSSSSGSGSSTDADAATAATTERAVLSASPWLFPAMSAWMKANLPAEWSARSFTTPIEQFIAVCCHILRQREAQPYHWAVERGRSCISCSSSTVLVAPTASVPTSQNAFDALDQDDTDDAPNSDTKTAPAPAAATAVVPASVTVSADEACARLGPLQDEKQSAFAELDGWQEVRASSARRAKVQDMAFRNKQERHAVISLEQTVAPVVLAPPTRPCPRRATCPHRFPSKPGVVLRGKCMGTHTPEEEHHFKRALRFKWPNNALLLACNRDNECWNAQCSFWHPRDAYAICPTCSRIIPAVGACSTCPV